MEAPIRILRSNQDRSVNFVHSSGQESRFVQRSDDYFIAYLSSHNGCSRSCRFCHLTQTKQLSMEPSSLDDMSTQLDSVLEHYSELVLQGQAMATRINLNWMARGEPLDNYLLRGLAWTNTIGFLSSRLPQHLSANFNLSTIMPSGFSYQSDLPVPNPLAGKTRIYYSLYSLDNAFRKRWLPRASDPRQALDTLAWWQGFHQGEVILHWSFIKGENDSPEDVEDIVKAVRASGLKTRFNIVRYNPFSPAQGAESTMDVILDRFDQLTAVAQVPGSKIVSRVGPDVYASCGMFVNRKKP